MGKRTLKAFDTACILSISVYSRSLQGLKKLQSAIRSCQTRAALSGAEPDDYIFVSNQNDHNTASGVDPNKCLDFMTVDALASRTKLHETLDKFCYNHAANTCGSHEPE